MLLRRIKESYPAIPKTVRGHYERDELINGTWLILKSRNVVKPSKLHVRMASIDFHRSQTKYRNTNHHGSMLTGDVPIPEKALARDPWKIDDIATYLRDIRRRFGTDGLTVFLLSKVMELNPNAVSAIMDYEPNIDGVCV